MSLAINLLFIGHRRLAVVLAEIQMHIDDMNWAGATRKGREFADLLVPQLHADEVFIRGELATLDGACKPAWQPLHAKRRRLEDEHHRLIQALEAHSAPDVQMTLPPLSDALKQWAQERMAALACIEGAHGDVSTELARALTPPPSGHTSH